MKNNDTTLEALRLVIEDNNRVMSQMLAYIKKKDSPWCDPDDAAELLGIPHSKSNRHRRVVAYLAKQGFIANFRPGRPYMYWRVDLLALAPRIASGEVHIPSRV